MRGRPGRGGAGGPGTPDSTGVRSPEAGAGGLPFRVRPESSDIAAHDPVILSDHDLAVIQKAVAAARQDGKDEPTAVRRLDENRTRRRRRLLLYALTAASIIVAAALVDHWGVLPTVSANTADPAQAGGPAQRPQLLPPLDQPPVAHFSNAVGAKSAPAQPSAQPASPAAGLSGAQNPAAWPAGSPASAESPQSATGESSGGGPSAIARGG